MWDNKVHIWLDHPFWRDQFTTNLDKSKNDLEVLIVNGKKLLHAMCYSCHKAEFVKYMKATHGDNADDEINKLPSFKADYQAWYSESLAVLKQLLPDRVEDFVRHYQKPKGRKDIDFENY